jgi:hypothetical protein
MNDERGAMNTFLTAEWRWLAMINYAIQPDVLRPLVPAGVELDSFEGVTYMSVVGFLFLNTRVLGLPLPFHRDFEEVNLRFYVRERAPEGWRRGVVFVKEIVPKRAIAAVARSVYGERYVRLPMRHRIEQPVVRYEWRIGRRWNWLEVRAQGAPALPAPDSVEEFIAEHYWGYTARRDGRTSAYRVEHAPWRVWQVAECSLECDVKALYGPGFADVLARPPQSAFLAEGSPVQVHRSRPASAQ